MKSVIQNILKIILVFAAVELFFIAVITLAAAIPTEKVKANVVGAYEVMVKEEEYPSPFFDRGYGTALYDNSTEAIYLNIIYNQDSSHPFTAAVDNFWIWTDSSETINALAEAINQTTDSGNNYTNYWLGMILPLKLLLVFMSYGQARYVFYSIGMALIVYLAYLIYKKINLATMFALLATIVVFCLPNNLSNVVALSDIYLMLVGSIILLSSYEKIKNNSWSRFIYFLVIGLFGSFLGFLYAPIFPITTILVLSMILDQKDGIAVKNQGRYLAVEILAWLLGYAGNLGVKQGLALLVDGFEIGTTKLQSWMSNFPMTDRFTAISTLFDNLINRGLFVIACLYIIVVIILIVAKRIRVNTINKTVLLQYLSLIAVGFVPVYIYCMILARAVGHRYYVHNLFGLVFVVFYICNSLFVRNKREFHSF